MIRIRPLILAMLVVICALATLCQAHGGAGDSIPSNIASDSEGTCNNGEDHDWSVRFANSYDVGCSKCGARQYDDYGDD